MPRRKPQARRLGDVGELQLIRSIQRLLGKHDQSVITGIGDDAAVTRGIGARDDLVLTTDAVIEDVHFTASAAPEWVGHKLAGRLLSDLAAMGAEPLWILCNVAAPTSCPLEWTTAVYRGMRRQASRHGASIVGGDVSRAEKRHLHGFAVGRLPRGSAVTRAGARPGDRIFVTGTLGGSILSRHLRFQPRVEQGLWLRENGWPSAMIDVSDGLLRDLGHLARSSRCRAEIICDAVPIAPDARRLRDGRSPLQHALSDGEDFELLFTVPAGKADLFIRSWRSRFRLRCTAIGRMVAGRPGVVLVTPSGRSVVAATGYEHFLTEDRR